MNYKVTYLLDGEQHEAEIWAEDDSTAEEKARLCYGKTAIVTRAP